MASSAKKEILKTPRGTRDLFGEELLLRDKIQRLAEEISRYYGFEKIQTPHIEHTGLFEASLGQFSDIVEKQMYAFRTRGGDQLTLRPEGTAPVLRAYFEHGMQNLPQPVLLWYAGSFFRHESPQRGRWREFGQFGLEILGEEGAVADAMIIRVFGVLFKELGMEVRLELNTLGDRECRPAWRKDLVSYYRRHQRVLCKDCKRRLKENPLRLLDCKEVSCVALREKAPQMIEYVCEACKKHFRDVLEFMDVLETPYHLAPHLVRGLDYYTRTVFEFTLLLPSSSPEAEVGRVELAGGGRYDYLAHLLAGSTLAAVGGALGMDRLAEVMKEQKREGFVQTRAPEVFLVQIGEMAKRKSLALVEEFRKAHIPLLHSLAKESIRSQLTRASDLGIKFSLILGQKEVMDGTMIIRDMDSGLQEIFPLSKIIETLKARMG